MLPFEGAGARSTHPDNKVADFERSGAWEIWCIKLGDTGETICDLNLVIVYKPHPDFRAMIPRVYWSEAHGYFIEFEYERQTGLSSAHLEAGSGEKFVFGDCDRPCLLGGREARAFVAFLENSSTLKIHFSDYIFQDFSVDVDLDGFREGLELLKRMQARFRRVQ